MPFRRVSQEIPWYLPISHHIRWSNTSVSRTSYRQSGNISGLAFYTFWKRKGLTYICESYTVDDAALLEKIRNPETRSYGFNLLVRAYQQRVYWHVRKMVIDHDDAD